MYRDDATRLRVMRDTAEDALSFIKHKMRADLDSDRMLARALVQSIRMIGQAAAQLTPECRAQHPAIPWLRLIEAGRDFLERYYEIDRGRVWSITSEDLPLLLPELEVIIPTLAGQAGRET